jgi:hypothetical protein
MDPPKSRPRRKAGEQARKEVNNIYKTGTKRPREPSTVPTQKARKRRADRTPPPNPEFPENCENALAALSGKSMTLGATTGVAGEQLLGRVQLRRRHFNECIKVRRRLTRVVISYCQPLRQAMRNAGPNELIRIIRDAMIVYYEAYKRPKNGFLHGGKLTNVLGDE